MESSMTGSSEDGGSFSFPMLKPPQAKVPLTAQSTVVHATSGAERPGAIASTSRPEPVKRNKVALEKGFSQVEWMRMSRSGKDMTGGAGMRREVSMDEVKQHKTADDAWMVIRGKVYNITPYLNYHPGGSDILVKAAGRDGTALFQRYHPWVNAHGLLEKCYLGNLGKGEAGVKLQLEGGGAAATAVAAVNLPKGAEGSVEKLQADSEGVATFVVAANGTAKVQNGVSISNQISNGTGSGAQAQQGASAGTASVKQGGAQAAGTEQLAGAAGSSQGEQQQRAE